MNTLRKIFKILFWSLVIWLFIRGFVLQTFRIPSASMYATLSSGDYVVINKLAYGARLPITPLSIKINDTKKYLDWIQLPYMRLFGFSNIKRNDLVAFNYELEQLHPTDIQEEYIKRCVALPGDTLKIIAGKVYANNKLTETNHAYYNYTVKSELIIDTLLLRNAGIKADRVWDNGKSYFLFMNQASADSLSKLKHILSVVIDLYSRDYYHPSIYPNSSVFNWNNDYFGPLWIPKKGDSILLTHSNLILYQRCIEKYENQTISFKQDSTFISGKKAKYYRFKQNYYFMMGDNRHNSIDSRVIGLIPEDHIIGKASFILNAYLNPFRKL